MSTSMPFGRYKGTPIEDLPDDYLSWLAIIDLRFPLRDAVTEEVWRRQEGTTPGKPAVPSLVDPEWAFEIIDAGKRALSMRYHPDLVHGDHIAQSQINLVSDWLHEHLVEVFVEAGVPR